MKKFLNKHIVTIYVAIFITSMAATGILIGGLSIYGLNGVLAVGILVGTIDTVCSGITAYREMKMKEERK